MSSSIASAAALCLRHTFIDVEERVCPAHNRSHSAPPSTSANRGGSLPKLYTEERAYIAELSEKYFGQHPIADFAMNLAEADAIEQSDSVGLQPKQDQETTTGSASTEVQSMDESQQGMGSSSEPPPRACSLGSMGHPELCSRPCLFYASGRCANGVNCEFCHMPHDFGKKAMHLSKKHRTMLEKFPQEKSIALVWSAVKDKVLAFDRSPATIEALGRLADSCPGLGETSDGIASNKTSGSESGAAVGEPSSLDRALRSLNMRRLILTLELVMQIAQGVDPASSTGGAGALVQSASEALVSRLRDVITSRA